MKPNFKASGKVNTKPVTEKRLREYIKKGAEHREKIIEALKCADRIPEEVRNLRLDTPL